MFLFCFFKWYTSKKNHTRSKAGKSKRNQRTKNRQRVNKAKIKCKLELARRDEIIENLQQQLKDKNDKAKSKHSFKIISSVCIKTAKATNFGKHHNIIASRDYLIQKVEGIPTISLNNYQELDIVIGSGVFGTVKVGRIDSLNLTVAEKVFDDKTSRKSMLAEVIALLTLSGNKFVPFCFGLMEGSTSMLMEFLGKMKDNVYDPFPTLATLRTNRNLNISLLKYIFQQIIKAIIYVHSKGILHNDIKSDNLVIAGDRVVLIDFGKATMIKCPVIYNIAKGSMEHDKYNICHRHLAHELRNVPHSKQTVLTDTYSVGYLFKHTAATLPYEPVIEIGRQMKIIDPSKRLKLEAALKYFQ